MEINCEHVWREVSNYLDGEVDADLRAAVEEHVRGCKRCAAVLDGTRNLLQLVGDDRVLELPVGFEKRLRQRLRSGRPTLAPRKNYFGWLVLTTAAALLIAAFAITNPASHESRLRSEMSHPAAGVPAALLVYVADDGKTFHVAGCRFLHHKANVRSMPASEALQQGYAPCIHCMKQYLSTMFALPAKAQEVAEVDAPDHHSRRTP